MLHYQQEETLKTAIVTLTAGLLALAGALIYVAATRPYTEPRPVPPGVLQTIMSYCQTGGGFYNESYIFAALLCVVAALVSCLVGLEYLKGRP